MLCLLTGRQVEHDANWGRVVDDFCPLVQVVHIIAAVIATVTKHQIQHQVLRESPKKTARKSKRSTPWQLRCSEPAAGWSSTSLFDYSIIRVPWEVVWTDYEHTVSSGEIITLESSIFEFFAALTETRLFLFAQTSPSIYIYLLVCCVSMDLKSLLPRWVSSFCQHCWSAASPAVAVLDWQEAWNRQLG